LFCVAEHALVRVITRKTGDPVVKLIRIRFADQESKRRALGFLPGRFSFTSYATGEVLVVESALTPLAVEGISFTVEGPATYAEAIPAFRTPPTPRNSITAYRFSTTNLPIRCWNRRNDLVRFHQKARQSPVNGGHEGHVYRDESVRVFIDVPDTEENRQFFMAFKETLKQRFQQIDIWMTIFPLEVI
jgi:hypothetical protein